LFYFHQFPNYFFLTNLIVIPLASIILYSAVALLLVSPISFLAKLIVYILKFFLNILIKSTQWINNFPYATTKGLFINLVEMFILYVLVILFFVFLIKKRKELFLWFLGALAVFLSVLNLQKPDYNYREIWILNVPKGLAINVLEGKTSFLLADTSFLYNTQKIERILSCYWEKRKINTAVYVDVYQFIIRSEKYFQVEKLNDFLKIYDKTFLIVKSGGMFGYSSDTIPKVDYVIVAENPYFRIEELKSYCDFDTIVFASSNYFANVMRWKSECSELDIPYYDIGQKGALRIFVK